MEHSQRIQALGSLNKLAAILRTLNTELRQREELEKHAEVSDTLFVDLEDLKRCVE